MKKTLINKLENIKERFEELEALLSDGGIIKNQELFISYSKEYAELNESVTIYNNYLETIKQITETKVLLTENDQDIKEIAQEELKDLEITLEDVKDQLQKSLLPKDSKDNKNIFLEIRAGTGGDEAAIFAGDLFRMYSRFAENHNWKIEVLSSSEGEHGGFKEIISKIEGKEVYSHLKFESGAHRVQRVPETESQGRVHTSACTVAVLPEPDELDTIEINPSDLRIDTYRSSGAGGQHVNTTDSAVRITHLPTGIVVECQEERSQHKNKARAMSWLSAKLENLQTQAAQKEMSEARKSLVGSGDRSERIRTYNFPQGRLTDHRINLTLYSLNDIVNGAIEPVIVALRAEYQASLLASLGDDN